MPVDSARIIALLAPIAGDNPSGRDLRYDPRYDKVKEARREDLDLPAGGLATERKVADWPQAVTVAGELLAKETKDLQLAAWHAEALLHRDGLGGLATGLAVLGGMLDQFWDTLYPAYEEDDLELRAGPLEWVGARFDIPVRQTPVAPNGISFLDHQLSRSVPTENDGAVSDEKAAARQEALASGRKSPEDVDRAVAEAPKAYYKALVADAMAAEAALASLEKTADARFGRDAPGFSRLRSALDEVRRIANTILAQKLELDPDPVEEIAPDDVGSYAAPDGWSGDGTVPIEPRSVGDAGLRVAAAARYLRAHDPTAPAPYLMLRGLRWGELRATLGDIDPKLLEAPPTVARARLKGLLLDGKWPELLEQGETLMATPHGRGWLDLQRYVLTACDHLGSGYDAVGAAIRGELRALLAALPRLPEMTLMDDTPTANAETRAWLAAEALDATGDAPDGAEDGRESDVEFGDGTEVLEHALAEEAAMSNGGLARASAARAHTNGARDPFALARAELAQKRPNRAIELLVAELSRERSARGRFVRQTQIAYVMVEAGLDTVARPILERLVAVIDERTLEEWEAGPLVAQPMALLCRVIDRLGDSYATDQRNELYLRVCRLDALQAIALQRTG